jgi:hypothetical protein
MAGGGVRVDITANSRGFRRGMNSNKSFLARWAKSVANKMAAAGRNIGRRLVHGITSTIRRGAMVAGGLLVAGVGKSISEAGRFEAYEMQFDALLGGAEEAKKRMQEIRDIDLEVPFDITSITDASRILTVFTNNAFASTDALRMMADAAAVTPNDIKDVAFWYGRAYSMIQSGRPFGEAAMRLQEMGLLTGEARNEMEKFSGVKSPQAIAKMMDLLNAEFLKFEGSSDRLMKTWKGISSVFSSAVKQSFAAVGDEILPLAKVWLQELIDKMAQLRNNGTLTRWGQNVSKALEDVRDKVKSLFGVLKGRFDFAKAHGATDTQAVVEAILGDKQSLSAAIHDRLNGVLKSIGNWVEKNSPAIAQVGLTIGGAVAKGIWDGWTSFVTKDKIQTWMRDSVPLGNFIGSSADVVGSTSGGSTDKDALMKAVSESYRLTFKALNPVIYGLTKLQMSMPQGGLSPAQEKQRQIELLQSIDNKLTKPPEAP